MAERKSFKAQGKVRARRRKVPSTGGKSLTGEANFDALVGGFTVRNCDKFVHEATSAQRADGWGVQASDRAWRTRRAARGGTDFQSTSVGSQSRRRQRLGLHAAKDVNRGHSGCESCRATQFSVRISRGPFPARRNKSQVVGSCVRLICVALRFARGTRRSSCCCGMVGGARAG